MTRLLIILLLTVLMAPGADATPPFHPHLPGFLILPEQRYDPAVQRYLAEQSLRALPLYNGQLYYVHPVSNSSTYGEQMQIRYLESMLREKLQDDEPVSD